MIAPGYDADLAIWDPDAKTTITPQSTLHRHKRGPYENRVVKGKNLVTYVRGRKVYDYGKIVGIQRGEFL
jgi:dihydroorotase-like cyclic amidohydrolase